MSRGSHLSNFWKTLGPGLLFAGTAIGVSHLVQSTRAGADFGLTLLTAVVAANLLKYPFFEFGSRYANIKGESLIMGYRRLGRVWFWLYVSITLGTALFVCSAVGIVTAGFLTNLLHSMGYDRWQVGEVMMALLVLGPGVLIAGRYSWLLTLMKLLGTLMVVCTIAAFGFGLLKVGTLSSDVLFPGFEWNAANFAFLMALMGWMPTAVDLSTWNSIWTIERMKESNFKPTLRQTLFEFRLGYWVSGILAVMFVCLGAFVIRNSGVSLSENSGVFSGQVIDIYASTIGEWTWPVMAVAAFSIMFGTFVAVFDGFGRALRNSLQIALTGGESDERKSGQWRYGLFVAALALGAWVLLRCTVFTPNSPIGFKKLVDVATSLSFLVAPAIAVMNYVLVTRGDFPPEARPGMILKTASLLGIVFLAGFAVVFMFF